MTCPTPTLTCPFLFTVNAAVSAAVCRVTDALLLQPRLNAAAADRPTSNLGEGWGATSPHFQRKLFKELSCSLCSLYSRLRELARKSKICRYFGFNGGWRSDFVCLLVLSLDLGLKTWDLGTLRALQHCLCAYPAILVCNLFHGEEIKVYRFRESWGKICSPLM